MYQNIQSLRKDLKFSQLDNYSFSAHLNFCPVFLQELPQVVREYFICFLNNDTHLPFAILGFEKGVNRYVTDAGEWRADYVPAMLRRYPFILARQKEREDYSVAVDMDAPHVKQETGEPLFDSQGQPTDILKSYMQLLRTIETQRERTSNAVQQIDLAGLFKTEQMQVKAGGQELGSIGGLRMVDEDKLAESGLTPGPALQLIYAHLFSKSNLQYGIISGKKDQKPAQEDKLDQLFGDDDVLRFDNI